jgi:hypothetical protein
VELFQIPVGIVLEHLKESRAGMNSFLGAQEENLFS